MNIKNEVQSVIDGILNGQILETFDQYYADDVIMSENGLDERVGKSINREYEEQFVNNVEFHNAEVGSVLVEGDKAAVEWMFEFTPKGGSRFTGFTGRRSEFRLWHGVGRRGLVKVCRSPSRPDVFGR